MVSYYIGPFNCPNWGQWNEWSECPYQHPCSENKTRHEQRKIRNCNKHDDCSIDCVGMTHNIQTGSRPEVIKVINQIHKNAQLEIVLNGVPGLIGLNVIKFQHCFNQLIAIIQNID